MADLILTDADSLANVAVANSTNGAGRVVPAGHSAYVPREYEVEAGFSLEIAAGACMEIG